MEAEKENISDRFSFDITLELETNGRCMSGQHKWAYNNFESCRTARNKQFPKMQCPDDVLAQSK